jgi:hypothetical protein
MKKVLSFCILFLAASAVMHAQVSVSGSTGANGTYTSLTKAGGAFAALNAGGSQAGNTIAITITADVTTEDGANGLNNKGWTALNISPSGNRTLSGNVALPLIKLNGTQNVTIDGLNTGGNSLTIANQICDNTAGTSTISLVGDAVGNTLKNCTILGSANGSPGTSAATATIILGSGGSSTGCDNNTIQNNNIGPYGSNLPSMAIASWGQSGTYSNDNNTVTGNNIYDYYHNGTYFIDAAAINIGSNSSSWTISDNKFYQTGSRSGMKFTNFLKSIYINTPSGGGYTISGNTIGYANSSGTGMFTSTSPGGGDYTGGCFTGIELTVAASPLSNIQGNTINGISWTTASYSETAGGATFNGIVVKNGGVNIGTAATNTIGAATGTGSTTSNIYIACTQSGTVGILPIYISSGTACTVDNNMIGAISAVAAAGVPFTFYGIYIAGPGNHTVTSNTIGNTTANNISIGVTGTTTAACNLYGVFSYGVYSASAGAITIGNSCGGNTIQNLSNNGSGSGSIRAIRNEGVITGTSSISYNTIDYLSFTAASTASRCYLIDNTGAQYDATLNITHNTFGSHSANYTGATGGSGDFIGISQVAAPLHETISENNFNNVGVKTTGKIILIYNTYTAPANGTKTVQNNVITTGFSRTVAAANFVDFYCYWDWYGSESSAIITISGNNFSNITCNTTQQSWFHGIDSWPVTNTNSSYQPTMYVYNNTVSNVTCNGSNGLCGLYLANFSATAGSLVYGNTVSGLSGSGYGSIYGMYLSTAGWGLSSTVSVYQNNVNTLSGIFAVFGIYLSPYTAGTMTSVIYKNKIYSLTTTYSSSGTVVFGICMSTGTVVNASNNLVGNLYAPSANSLNALVGIALYSTLVSSTNNIYYNTIYLNASSTGTDFGTTGIYHTASSTASTAALNLRNNIIVNKSTPRGAGKTVAYRRSGTDLANYVATSNNNIFYGGTPGAANLIFYDGTNADQTLAAYKARVNPRDANSFTEDVAFLSTIGSDATFLHINPGGGTQAESGAVNIATYTDDYEGDIRQGNPGYVGTGTAPDIGADETAVPLSPVEVYIGAVLQASYSSLKAAFDRINDGTHTGAITIKIVGNTTETATAVLYASGGGGSYTSINIYPTGSGLSVSGNLAAPLIDLNGADNVTIDGRVNGTGSTVDLTIVNTSTSNSMSTSTIRLYDEATFNTVKYCTLLGSATGATGISPMTGTVFFEGGSMNPACSNNTIQNNNIGAAGSNLPRMAIASYAMASSYANDYNTVNGNNIYDFYGAATSDGVGINLGDYSAGWTISNNKFYQTAPRSGLGNSKYLKSIYINCSNWFGGFTVTGNIIGYANSAGTGMLTNTCGRFTGIELILGNEASTVSNVQNNTINHINWTSACNSHNPGGAMFNGIIFSEDGTYVSMMTPSNIENNIIGETGASNTGSPTNGIYITSTTSGSGIYPVYVRTGRSCLTLSNNIGAIATNGTSDIGFYFYGIYVAGAGYHYVGNNTVGNATADNISIGVQATTTAACNLYGIYSAATYAVYIDGYDYGTNYIRNLTNHGSGTGTIQALVNSGAASLFCDISYNYVDYLSFTASNASTCYLINNTAGTSITITFNAFGAHSANYKNGAVGSGKFYAINQSGTPNSNTISDNTFGNISVNTTGEINLIYNSYAAPAGGTKSVSNNIANSGFTRTVASSADFNCYYDAGASPASTTYSINSNNFSNISCNTTGNATFRGIYCNNSSFMPNISFYDNTVSGITFNGNSVYGFYLNGVPGTAGTPKQVYGNTFSGLTSSGNTILEGFYLGGNSAYVNLFNNTVSNFTLSGTATTHGIYIGGGTAIRVYNNTITGISNSAAGAIYGAYVSTGTTISLYQNTLNTLSGADEVQGISVLGGSTVNIYEHKSTYSISDLTSTGAAKAVCAINISGGSAVNIYNNKIYNIRNTSTGNTVPLVNGILLAAGTTVNAYNNTIGDLTAPSANYADAVRGISVTSTTGNTTYNLYYNTVYINASSTGTNFGTTGIYHNAYATATMVTLDLRNNIIVNKSAPNGTGLTVVLRKSGTSLNNYAATSNNNAFYGGTPGTTRLIYYDGTNADQTLADFKARVTPRDANSVTEDVPFLSTTGSDAAFLHIDPAAYTQVESGAVNIVPITDDFDGDKRQGNGGYGGVGCAPDIGADEGEFTLDPTSKTWNGTATNAWGNASNWTPCGVPTLLTNVTIPSGTLNPCIIKAVGALCNNMLIKSGALVTINVATDITVGGTLTISAGGSLNNSGTVKLKGSLDNQNP